METLTNFIFLGSKITDDGDCSHETKRRFLLGRKAITNLVQFSCSVVSNPLWPHGLHAACQASLSIANSQSLLKFMSIMLVMPSNHLILCCPFSSCLQSFPASGSFSMSQFFASGGQKIGVSASASALPMNIQDWSPLGGLVWSPCNPRNSQESSPKLQFKSINSSVLSFLCGPTHICTWPLENRSFG